MNLIDLLFKLEKSGLAVFTVNDLRKLLGLKKNVLYVYISRMLKKGYIFKVERGKYSLYQDPFIVSTQLVHPSYISFLTALYLHAKTSQTINEIQIATSKRKGKMSVFGMRVNFIKLDPKFMFGFRRVEKGNSYIFLAELEKAIVDSLYLPKYCPLSETFLAIKEANVEKLVNYALKINIEAVNRRLGYMLDLLGIRSGLSARTKTVYKLNPSLKSKGKFNSKWRLYINEVLV